jgi:hypothetical protein
MEPDVTIRIIPEATRSSHSSTKTSTDRSKNTVPARQEDVQIAHVAVFATACNASQPRLDIAGPDNEVDDMMLMPDDIEDKFVAGQDGKLFFS